MTMHKTKDGLTDPFIGLEDPFYAIDSRDYQVVQPKLSVLKEGSKKFFRKNQRPFSTREHNGGPFTDYFVELNFILKQILLVLLHTLETKRSKRKSKK
jgi:hypothetical protein